MNRNGHLCICFPTTRPNYAIYLMLHYCLADTINFGPRFEKRSRVQQTIELPESKKDVLSTATREAKWGIVRDAQDMQRPSNATRFLSLQIFTISAVIPLL